VFFAIVPIHSRCFRQLCNKSLPSCLVAQAIGELECWCAAEPRISAVRSAPQDPLRRADRMRGNDRHGSGSSRACNRYCPLKPLPPILSRLRTTGPEPEPTGVALGRLALQGPSRCQSINGDFRYRTPARASKFGAGPRPVQDEARNPPSRWQSIRPAQTTHNT
jgi:hypothetical protein